MDIKTALATIKTAISLAQTAKQAELLNQLIEVQQALLEAYDDAITIRSENTQLRKDLADLQAEQAAAEEMVLLRGLYYLKAELNEQGEPHWEATPICSNCWDVRKVITRVQWGRPRKFDCPNCKAEFREHYR